MKQHKNNKANTFLLIDFILGILILIGLIIYWINQGGLN